MVIYKIRYGFQVKRRTKPCIQNIVYVFTFYIFESMIIKQRILHYFGKGVALTILIVIKPEPRFLESI